MTTNKNSNKNIINIHIGDKSKKKKKRKSNQARRRSDQPLTIVNSTNNAPPINFISPQQPPPFNPIHPAVLHQNRSQVPDFTSQVQRERNSNINNLFQDAQQEQKRNIVSSILHNENNDPNPLIDHHSIASGYKNEAMNELILNHKADEHYKQRLLSKGLNTINANKDRSQTNRYNEIKGDIHHNDKQLNRTTAFNNLKNYKRPPLDENQIIGISSQEISPLDQSFYKEINNPVMPDASALTKSIAVNTKQIEESNKENRKRLQFSTPRKLDFTPEVQSTALSLFQSPPSTQSSSESTQFTPLQLTETKKRLKPVEQKSTKEVIKELEKYLQQEELDETMTPEKSKKAVANLERFLNEEQLNTSLELPKNEYKINLADNKNENEPIDLTKFKDPLPEDDKIKEANIRYQKALRQQKRMEDEQRLKARKDVLSSQLNPSLDLQGVQAEQKKKDTYFKAQVNNRFSGYGTEPLKYVKENYENDFDKLKLWAEKNPNERLGPKSNNTLWKLYLDYLYSSNISNKHPGPSIKSATLLKQIDDLKPSLQKNLKLFQPSAQVRTITSGRGVTTIHDLPSVSSGVKPEVIRRFGEPLPKQSNQLVKVSK